MELRIVRRTDHFDEACRFYGELLAWPVTREWPASDGHGQGRIFGYGDVGRMELIDESVVAPVAGIVVSVEHDGVDALYERLIDAGIIVLAAPADQPWGHRSMTVLDPAGVEVTFFEHIAT